MIYAKDKKPESAVKPEEMVHDDILDRAVELLKAREVLGALKTEDAPSPAPSPAPTK